MLNIFLIIIIVAAIVYLAWLLYSDLKKESRKIDKKDIDFWIGSEWKLGRKMIF